MSFYNLLHEGGPEALFAPASLDERIDRLVRVAVEREVRRAVTRLGDPSSKPYLPSTCSSEIRRRRDVGRRVRRFRHDANLPMMHAALRAGIAHRSWQMLEEGVRAPSHSTLVRVAQALGVRVGDLVGADESSPWRIEPPEGFMRGPR